MCTSYMATKLLGKVSYHFSLLVLIPRYFITQTNAESSGKNGYKV